MCQCKKGSGCGCCSSCECGCQKSQCGCKSSCGCGSSCCSKDDCCKPEKFLELADQAWKEVLKEKIKKHIEANSKNLDELAAIISEANHERWSRKMDGKQCGCCFEEKLENFFGRTCSTNGHKDVKNK